jgi:hypothetical protein
MSNKYKLPREHLAEIQAASFKLERIRDEKNRLYKNTDYCRYGFFILPLLLLGSFFNPEIGELAGTISFFGLIGSILYYRDAEEKLFNGYLKADSIQNPLKI